MDIKLYGTIYRATIRLRFVVTGRLVCCKTSRLFSVSIVVTGPIQAKRCSRINTISPVLAVNVGQRSATIPPPYSITHPTRLLFSFNREPTDRTPCFHIDPADALQPSIAFYDIVHVTLWRLCLPYALRHRYGNLMYHSTTYLPSLPYPITRSRNEL